MFEWNRDFAVPPRPGCYFAQSVRDLDVATGFQREGQGNMCWGNRRCVSLSIFVYCVRVCECVRALICYEGGPPGLV